MGGERLVRAKIRKDGVAGDRVLQVWDANARIVTARTRPRLLAHAASLDDSAEPRVDGLAWTDPEITRRVEAAAGRGAWLLVATDGSLAAFGRDPRRLRPNLVIAGVEGLAEREWEGRTLRVGRALIGLADLRGRCVMTTWDPDTQAQDVGVRRDIARRFDGRLCLNALVLEPGT